MLSNITCISRSRFLGSMTIVLSSIVSSCTSLVYTPALHVPVVPIQKDQTQIVASISSLVETIKDSNRPNTTRGGLMALRYGFSSALSLQAKYWSAFDHRGGVSISALYLLAHDSAATTYLHVESGMAHNKNSMDGWATAFRYIYSSHEANVGFHAGIGPMFGYHSTYDALKGEWGSALLCNVGTSWAFASQWQLQSEIAFVMQYNHPQRTLDFVVSPTIGIMLTL